MPTSVLYIPTLWLKAIEAHMLNKKKVCNTEGAQTKPAKNVKILQDAAQLVF